jgi:hypothetical protein
MMKKSKKLRVDAINRFVVVSTSLQQQFHSQLNSKNKACLHHQQQSNNINVEPLLADFSASPISINNSKTILIQ